MRIKSSTLCPFDCDPSFNAGRSSRSWTRNFNITLNGRLNNIPLKASPRKRHATLPCRTWMASSSARRNAAVYAESIWFGSAAGSALRDFGH